MTPWKYSKVTAEEMKGLADAALELGFASSIRREWAWRAKRGESLANLRAFARFADPERGADGSWPGH